MARKRKIDSSGWKEEGRVENIDTHVASEVRQRGPETYNAAYNAAKTLLEEEQMKAEAERKSLDDIRVALQKAEPHYEQHNPERSQEFNNQVTIRNNVQRHLWDTHNRAISDVVAGKQPSYQAPSIRLA